MASKNCAAHWEQAEAVIIGAGSGLSTSADFVYMWERFEKHFYDGIVADYPQTVWIDIQVDVTGIIIKWKNTQLLWSSMFNCHYRHRTVWIGFILCSVEFRGGNDLITQCYYSSNQRSYFRISFPAIAAIGKWQLGNTQRLCYWFSRDLLALGNIFRLWMGYRVPSIL